MINYSIRIVPIQFYILNEAEVKLKSAKNAGTYKFV